MREAARETLFRDAVGRIRLLHAVFLASLITVIGLPDRSDRPSVPDRSEKCATG